MNLIPCWLGPGGEWSTENALGKLLAGTEWKTSFRGGVNLDEKFVEQHLCNQSLPEYEDYQSRYDLTFRTPIEGQLTLKVSHEPITGTMSGNRQGSFDTFAFRVLFRS